MRNWHGNLSPFGKWHTSEDDAEAIPANAIRDRAGNPIRDRAGNIIESRV